MVASGCPIGFWPYAFEHAVDVLNRATGPTDSRISSFEMLEGTTPFVGNSPWEARAGGRATGDHLHLAAPVLSASARRCNRFRPFFLMEGN